MAVRNRILNSTMPFTGAHKEHGGLFAVGSSLKQVTGSEEKRCEVEQQSNKIPPLLSKVLMRGTADHIIAGQLIQEKPSLFIAQAECEGQQEFSPSSWERPYVASPSCFQSRVSIEHNNVARKESAKERPSPQVHQHSRRKTKDKRQRRRKQNVKEEPRQRQRQRTPSGVPEQESSSALQVIQKGESECISSNSGTSVVYNDSTHTLGIQETAELQWEAHIKPVYSSSAKIRGPSSSTLPWGSTSHSALPNLSFYSQECSSGSDSPLNCSLALRGLRGSVCQEDRCFAPAFYREVEREAKTDSEGTTANEKINEGLLFHPEEKLQPNDYEYRENKDYLVLNHIQNGSFGEVFRVRDLRTSFECAAKKIPLDCFRSEEVGTWSALTSRRVVELFGAVREGPFVVLFMALKSGSVGKLLKQRGRLPEDLALHYHCQLMEAVEDLHRKRVMHLDIKADNMLLSEDGKDAYLSDFGHSQRLDQNGKTARISAGEEFPGTESHMAPEVVKGEAVDFKADVWSSCCMLLHMLTGCPPWTRYYSHPLCLTIANEAPPLREIPHDCRPETADVIKAGFVKDPIKRASAKELRAKTMRALQEVGGLTSPVHGDYREPEKSELMESSRVASRSIPSSLFTSDMAPLREHFEQVLQPLSPRRKKVHVDDSVEEEDDAVLSSSSPEPLISLQAKESGHQKNKRTEPVLTRSEQELQKLERDFYLSSLSQPYSPELQEQMLSCLSSSFSSYTAPGDKDFVRWSVSTSDDLSSGVFSYNSQSEGQKSFSKDWLGSSSLPTPRCFEGVDVYIKDLEGHCLKIRENHKVKVGHIAIGISEQISEQAFSLETQDGQPVSPDEEVQHSGFYLRCTRAPNRSDGWTWRVREGMLETRN
ncbi:mitogen-activated protein kinase kinase kinase 14-like isoform X1 [Brienomyrus brachyistius]|uniref:mitogen-activated protein kinase kinase kinase 14-like isoform X1 n=1 Tax=Brienomyrus brachyistius TaxID=42636 RepID=UPI0020B35ED0|nr:mitogen-activated protein kinase kinase kinase 14-like isoform X1 [Brienomyrus brachyistius]XP_048847811.1 mitogen-activated protein kinase kinase kinase 14-like isoform X1 [Brienomyrus brachyistius]XP_048847812.1 mitogen-activated protein kinase kinase kinase 14-like isoform X1 [Brienomyrus brachyistius]